MSVFFRSLRSGSAGNCLLLGSDTTKVLIDFGLPSQRLCREILEEHLSDPHHLSAVIVSHNHSDHINYSALRVLEKHHIPLIIHQDCVEDLRRIHFRGHPFDALSVRVFDHTPFKVGTFEFHPIRVPHHYKTPNFGFAVYFGEHNHRRKIVVMTDCCRFKGMAQHFANAHFIFVEANHDPELLQKHPNENSRFHLSNVNTAEVLAQAWQISAFPPKATMLGHLSEERNSGELALRAVCETFQRHCLAEEYALHVAPGDRPSAVIRLE